MKDIQFVLKCRSGEELSVDRLGADHRSALQQFNSSLSDQTRSVFLPHDYDDKTIARYVKRALADEDRIYVLLSKNEIVGYFFLWEFQSPVPLLGIGLADAYQGQGLGRQMMAILIEDARSAGCDGIELTTVPENERAFHLYEKSGFQYLDDVENMAGDGRVVCERRMFLPLKEGASVPVREFKPPV